MRILTRTHTLSLIRERERERERESYNNSLLILHGGVRVPGSANMAQIWVAESLVPKTKYKHTIRLAGPSYAFVIVHATDFLGLPHNATDLID
jgi:hypothetical protein